MSMAPRGTFCSIPGMFQCAMVPLLSAKCFFQANNHGSSKTKGFMKRTGRNLREELISWRLRTLSISVAHVVHVRQTTVKHGFCK